MFLQPYKSVHLLILNLTAAYLLFFKLQIEINLF